LQHLLFFGRQFSHVVFTWSGYGNTSLLSVLSLYFTPFPARVSPVYLAQLCETDQEIRAANELIQEFTTMLRERRGECLDAWLEKAEQQGIPELRGFALSLKRDYEAVKAGLTLVWSQGPVEGHVHRLKLLKRQAYGRASFQTLRKRVLRYS
jgi:transposase